MIEIEATCTRCGTPWTPDHHDYVRNTWRTCPRCRAGPDATGIRSHVGSTQRVTGDSTASDIEVNEQNEGKTP